MEIISEFGGRDLSHEKPSRGSFHPYRFNQELNLDSTLSRPKWEYGIRGLVYGGILGCIGGTLSGAFVGFEGGEYLSQSYQITNHIAQYSIDVALSLTGSAIGLGLGTLTGALTGGIGMSRIGETIEKKDHDTLLDKFSHKPTRR